MNKTIKKAILLTLIATMLIASSGTLQKAHAVVLPNWDVSGTWDFANSSDHYPAEYGWYYKTMTIQQDANGVITGSGQNLDSPWNWDVSGNVAGNTITLHLHYTNLPGNPDYVATFVGTIDSFGMSGEWTDVTGDFGSWFSYNGQASRLDIVLTFPPGFEGGVNIIPSEDPPTFTFGGEGQQTLIQPLSMVSVQLPNLPGHIGLYYNVIVTGPINGPVQVCVKYDPTGMTLKQQQQLRLFIGDPVDFNGDGTVNGQDITLMQKAVKSGTNDPRYDINHDGYVTNADLLIVKDYASHGLIVNQGRNGLSQARLPWMDITTHVDTVNHYVCGVTGYFSGFGIH